ncbi:MAG TPA: HAD family phosphatase [Bryobacteraceae bacterium]|nr:HAD family phosphatase [Bryobacteraceae bacterium]
MSYQAILFDFDGVLMDSEPVHFACWNEALRPLGFHIDWETYAATTIGISEDATMELFARISDPPLDLDEVRARYPVKKELFRAHMAAKLPFAPGVREFIASLDGRYKLAVVTSSARVEIEPLLERGGIRQHFGAVVCAEDVAHHKPAPDPYLLAARLLGAESALVAEDSEPGMESARAAGFDAVRIPAAAQTVELVRAALRLP